MYDLCLLQWPQIVVKMGSFMLPLPDPHANKVGECRKEVSTVPSWLSFETLEASAGCAGCARCSSSHLWAQTHKERRRSKFWGTVQCNSVRLTSDLDSSYSLHSYLVPSQEKRKEKMSPYHLNSYLLTIYPLTNLLLNIKWNQRKKAAVLKTSVNARPK